MGLFPKRAKISEQASAAEPRLEVVLDRKRLHIRDIGLDETSIALCFPKLLKMQSVAVSSNEASRVHAFPNPSLCGESARNRDNRASSALWTVLMTTLFLKPFEIRYRTVPPYASHYRCQMRLSRCVMERVMRRMGRCAMAQSLEISPLQRPQSKCE